MAALGRVERLRRLLGTIDKTMEAHAMGINLTPQEMFEVFGEHDPTQYAGEARARWGGTDAYRQSRERTSRYTKADWQAMKDEANAVQQRLADLSATGVPATDPQAMDAAEAHRQHIIRWFYDCPPAMHRGLGEMYLADPRFTRTYEEIAAGLVRYVRDAVLANADRQEAAEG